MNSLSPELEVPLGKRTLKYRLFEMLPGVLSWSIIALPVVLSFLDTSSKLAAVFILFFMISWFYRAVGLAFRTLQGYHNMQSAARTPWLEWNNDLEKPEEAINNLVYNKKRLRKSTQHHLENLREYMADLDLQSLKPSEVIHFVIVPVWKESYEIVEPTIASLAKSQYDVKKLVVVIAYEQRGGEEPEKTAGRLVKQYQDTFMHIRAIKHVDGPNEVIGKGGNVTFAARQMLGYFKKQAINPARVMVTTLDSDNHPHQHYFAHLTYSYVLTHDRKHNSYQPLSIYTNNIWDVPAPMRVLAVGNSFFTIVQSVRPHLLRNFTSHAQSLDALIETDFWSTRSVVEDGHQFWRSYFVFKGNHQVVPIYTPIYQDAVLSDSYRQTLRDQFIQMRRWAYGASDIPYIANLGFRRKEKRIVPLYDFILKFCRLLDTHVSWATVSLILLLAARIPLLIGGSTAQKSIIAHQLPLIASYAQTLALVGLFISIFFSLRLLPPRPARYKRRRNILMVAQWVLLPFTSIIYGSCAALNSQTRLLFGHYLEKFDHTHKGRKNDKVEVNTTAQSS